MHCIPSSISNRPCNTERKERIDCGSTTSEPDVMFHMRIFVLSDAYFWRFHDSRGKELVFGIRYSEIIDSIWGSKAVCGGAEDRALPNNSKRKEIPYRTRLGGLSDPVSRFVRNTE